MPVLINTESLVADVWHRYDGSAEALPANEPCLLPVEEWIEHPVVWRDFASDVGVILSASDDPARLCERLHELALVALEFADSDDGLGLTHARQLRDQLGYSGAIRALGPVTADHVAVLARNGFDQFELADEQQAQSALRTLRGTDAA